MPLATYMTNHKDIDPTYGAKAAVSAGAIETPPILAVSSAGGRIGNLIVSPYNIDRNNIEDSLAGQLTTEKALTLCLPQTPDAMFSGNRTMHQYFKWIYNILLVPGNDPGISVAGEVAAPTAAFTLTPNGDQLTVDFTCPAGATVYYSIDSGTTAPLNRYEGTPITLDVTGRNLSTNPVQVFMTAVREGYADGGITKATYPESTPPFNAISSGTLGKDVVFTATSSVTDAQWTSWWSNLSGVDIQPPGGFYTPLAVGSGYLVDGTSGGVAKTLTIPAGAFGNVAGSYNIRIKSNGYADRTLSLTMRKTAPAVTPYAAYINGRMDFTFADANYGDALSVSIRKEGAGGFQTIPSPYLIRAAGRLTISASYYAYNNCIIREAGRYIVSFDNASYTPTSQELAVDIRPQSESPDTSYQYTLTPAVNKAYVGEVLRVDVSLRSNASSYKLYAGEYRVAIPVGLTLGKVTNQAGWRSEKTTFGGEQILTFVYMASNAGADVGTSVSLGSFEVTPTRAGSLMIRSTSALLTDADAITRGNVSGSNLTITAVKYPEEGMPPPISTIEKRVKKLHSPIKTIYLKKGSSLTLPAMAYDKAGKTLSVSLQYSSSRTAVATVNSKGKITAKKAGTAKITIRSKNGTKKIVTVKVVKKAKKISRIVVSTSSAPAKMKVGKTYYLTFQATPKNATYGKITLKSSNKSILTIDKAGKIAAKKKGKVTITVKVGGVTVKRGITIQ
jgi:hypothetical protein